MSKKINNKSDCSKKLRNISRIEEYHRNAVDKARQFLEKGGGGIQCQVKPLRRKAASKWFSLEAAVDDKEDVSGDEDEEDEDAIGDEVPEESFAFKHPLDSTNNASSIPEKVISFEGVSTADTAKALLFLIYDDCKYHSILNLKLMFSIKYLIYDLKFVHMVLLVMHDKQFELVNTPIKFTGEKLEGQISIWKNLTTERKHKLYSSFKALYNGKSLISQQTKQVRITEYS